MPNNRIELPTIYPIACHTDNVGPGTTFVVIKGQTQDGVDFIPLALEKGAKGIVLEFGQALPADLVQLINQAGVSITYVHNARKALAQLSAQAYGYPAKSLKIIGITGTKGKTTSSFLVHHILRKAGKSVALTTTIHNAINDHVFTTNLTTRHPDFLHTFFDVCVKHGVEYVVMEVAAQAVSLHRVEGIQFDGVLFTNFDQEHGEFYASLEDYFAAKSSLFDQCKAGGFQLINADDIWCKRLIHRPNIKTFSFKNQNSSFFAALQSANNGINFTFGTHHFHSNLIGVFNAYNCFGALIIAKHLKIDEHIIQQALAQVPPIPGRMQTILLPYNVRCIVDYAHTPSSYESLLSTLRSMTEQLIVVFGCGGARDPVKRPLMGGIAAKWADAIVLTSDNPRNEDPLRIIADIIQGVDKAQRDKILIEPDRQLAIEQACELAKSHAIVAVLGKGPDHYQIIGKQKTYFNDVEVIHNILQLKIV